MLAQLPLFFSATFAVTLILTPAFSCLVSYWPRKIVIPVVYAFFIACQLVFIPLFNTPNLLSIQTLGIIFFVWVSVFNLFVVSVFWSFMTDIWSELQARRLFPLIALGGTTGAIFGPIITKNLVDHIGLGLLLVISIVLLSLAIACIVFLSSWANKYGLNRDKSGNEAPIGGGILDGLKQIFTNPFIFNIALMMVLNDGIGTIAYVLVTDYSGLTFPNDPIAQTQFAASMDLTTNIIQIILQLTVARWILVRYGPSSVFAICAAILIAVSLIVAFNENPYAPILGIFPIVALFQIISRSLSYSMIQASRETLYTLVPRDVRYKGKNAVDTVVWRSGDLVSLLLINGLRTLGVSVPGFAAIWAILAAASGSIGYRLANRVEKGEFEK